MSKKFTLLFITLILLLTACASKPEEEAKQEPNGRVSYEFFDTVSYIYNYGEDTTDEFKKLSEEVFSILREYHQLCDIYNEYEGINNLCTINKNAGETFEVDPKLIEFLDFCKELYKLTEGKTNVMLGSVLRIWHNYRDEGSAIPSLEELEEANLHTDIDLLVIDHENNTVTITDPEASIDVGAIAKGYGTEKAGQYIESLGKSAYVLNIGGNIRIVGTKPNGDSWSTAVIDPKDRENFALHIYLADTAFVTSGDYIRFYVVDGKRYHHIIDPDTLFPSDYFASVSIYCKDSGLADALSTALFSMSYEKGLELAEKLDIGVIWIYKNGDIKYTQNLKNLIY